MAGRAYHRAVGAFQKDGRSTAAGRVFHHDRGCRHLVVAVVLVRAPRRESRWAWVDRISADLTMGDRAEADRAARDPVGRDPAGHARETTPASHGPTTGDLAVALSVLSARTATSADRDPVHHAVAVHLLETVRLAAA